MLKQSIVAADTNAFNCFGRLRVDHLDVFPFATGYQTFAPVSVIHWSGRQMQNSEVVWGRVSSVTTI